MQFLLKIAYSLVASYFAKYYNRYPHPAPAGRTDLVLVLSLAMLVQDSAEKSALLGAMPYQSEHAQGKRKWREAERRSKCHTREILPCINTKHD